MENSLTIRSIREDNLFDFLGLHDFEVEDLGNDVYAARREDELPVFIKQSDGSLYFEVDLGSAKEVSNEAALFKILDLNTDILPVSFAINTANPDDPRLVLVESRIMGDISDSEILSVFDALELATDRAEELLAEVMS